MRSARPAAFVALLILAACSESGGITRPEPPVITPPDALAAIPCTVDVRAREMRCADAVAGSGVRGDRIFGGQRVNVTLTSTNVTYDAGTGIFGADVTVQNLLVQRMGSDGTTVTGVKVFFASGPNATSGTGLVEVRNADGIDTFTGSGQPYFYYPGALPPNATSAVKRWEWNIPSTVLTFAFTVYVSTPIVPTIVAEMAPGGNRDVYRMGIDGNDVVALSTSLLSDVNPSVALGKVVFTSYRDGNAELYSVPLRGGAETRLTTTTTINETTPALSPDATKLAWSAGAPGAITKIWTGAADATGATVAVSATGDAIESSPNWKSATQLAFTSSAGGSADIYGLTLGGTPSVLAGGSSADVEGAWSPDGTRVAFASNRSGDTELYILTVATNVVTRLTTRTGSDGAPTWLADGRIVYTCTQGAQFRLCIIDPANAAAGGTILNTPYQADHASAVRF
ncbi:MAG TPA: hypothetical protein VF092_10955 [Longimicrobium sp.]